LVILSTQKARFGRDFTIYVETQGAHRGVPVPIGYQPNGWFQVVQNLLPEKSVAPDSAVAAR
jgi:hypothetical protein